MRPLVNAWPIVVSAVTLVGCLRDNPKFCTLEDSSRCASTEACNPVISACVVDPPSCASHADCASGLCLVAGTCAHPGLVQYLAPQGNGTSCTRVAPCFELQATSTHLAARPYIAAAPGTYALTASWAPLADAELHAPGAILLHHSAGPLISGGAHRLTLAGPTLINNWAGPGLFCDGCTLRIDGVTVTREIDASPGFQGVSIRGGTAEISSLLISKAGLGLWLENSMAQFTDVTINDVGAISATDTNVDFSDVRFSNLSGGVILETSTASFSAALFDGGGAGVQAHSSVVFISDASFRNVDYGVSHTLGSLRMLRTNVRARLSGVVVRDASLTIANSDVRDAAQWGLDADTSDVFAAHNVFADNGTTTAHDVGNVKLGASPAAKAFYYNTVVRGRGMSNSFHGLVCGGLAQVWGNIFWANDGFDVWRGANDCADIQFNTIDGAGVSGSNIDRDPMLVDLAGGDYHLQPNSPMRDAGGSLCASTLPDYGFDIDGDARPTGPACDIGADELP